jgi:D-aspartate ligase
MYDKERFSTLAGRAGVLTPKTLGSGEDIDDRLEELREPLLVKPKRKAAWKEIQRDLFDGRGKARVFKDRKELLAHPGYQRHKDEVIVQEYLGGGVEQLSSFHGFADREARLLASFAGRKIRTSPKFAGESCFIELSQDAAVFAAGRDVVKRLGLKGPFKIDFIQDPRTMQLYTLEINARFNLWHRLGAAHGVNLPLCAYEYLVHGKRPVRDLTYTPRYRWLALYGDVQAFREQRENGELGLFRWLLSIADPRVLHDTFALRDPLPFLRWAASMVRKKFV